MFYHKGEFHPLLSDHPDIKKACKAWDEIVLSREKPVNGDVLQGQDNSHSNNNNVLFRYLYFIVFLYIAFLM